MSPTSYAWEVPATSSRLRIATAGALVIVGVALGACSTTATSSTASLAASSGVGSASPFLAGNLSTISCGPSSICTAGGSSFNPNAKSSVLIDSTDAGTTWKQATRPIQPVASITDAACAATSCLVVGTVGTQPLLLRSAGKAHVFASASEPTAGVLEAVACSGPTHCLGIAASSSTLTTVTSTNAGATWLTGSTLPSSAGRVLHLSCDTPHDCVSAGIDQHGTAQVLVTTDTGGAWTPLALPKKVTSVLQAACRTGGTCLVVARKDGGTTPLLLQGTVSDPLLSKIPMPGQLIAPDAVTCISSTCVVVGSGSNSQGAASSLTRSSWHTIALTFAPTALVDVSCTGATSCSAIGSGSVVRLAPAT